MMLRATFANIRLRNRMVEGKEGGYTRYLPDGELMTIYDAAMKYKESGTPLLVIAGKEYGTGSSRDWAAKGTSLLGVKAVLAESFERIHRSNLVGMGVLPIQFEEGMNAAAWGLNGTEEYVLRVPEFIQPKQIIQLEVVHVDGRRVHIPVIVRLDSQVEIGPHYIAKLPVEEHGHIFDYVRKKDAEGAERAMRMHIRRSLDTIKETLETYFLK